MTTIFCSSFEEGKITNNNYNNNE